MPPASANNNNNNTNEALWISLEKVNIGDSANHIAARLQTLRNEFKQISSAKAGKRNYQRSILDRSGKIELTVFDHKFMIDGRSDNPDQERPTLMVQFGDDKLVTITDPKHYAAVTRICGLRIPGESRREIAARARTAFLEMLERCRQFALSMDTIEQALNGKLALAGIEERFRVPDDPFVREVLEVLFDVEQYSQWHRTLRAAKRSGSGVFPVATTEVATVTSEVAASAQAVVDATTEQIVLEQQLENVPAQEPEAVSADGSEPIDGDSAPPSVG